VRDCTRAPPNYGDIVAKAIRSEFYDAFTNVQKGLFSTRDRAEHSRKRKIISHTFSQKSVIQFEQYIRQNLAELVNQWDKLSAKGCGDFSRLNVMPWMNYLAFDIIGDLSFGMPFGMVAKGEDVAEIRLTPGAPITQAPAISIFNARSDLNAAFGCWNPQLKPYAKYIPGMHQPCYSSW
jgi:benzoate 4-monooxygenase